MSRRLAVLAFLCAAPAGASSGYLVHLPAESAVRGMPVAVSAEVHAMAPAAVRAYVYNSFRREFAPVELGSTESGSWQGLLPDHLVGGLSLYYYLEAVDDRGQVLAQAGSTTEPYLLPLLDAAPQGVKWWHKVAGWLAAAMALFVFGRTYTRREQDKAFWREVLGPVASLDGRDLRLAVNRISQESLHHPVHGQKQYDRNHLLAKVGELRKTL